MWTDVKNNPARGFWTPPPLRNSRPSPKTWKSEKKKSPADLFHIVHKVPAGDSPYVKAKHVQLIDKDPNRAISLFWAAINSGDRVDSALKDMALVMKQLNRPDEAIEAIKSFRSLCSDESQQSLDNILVELYKRSSRLDEQIEVLQAKLKQIEEGFAFSGEKRTRMARSHGKKVQITVEQEYARILGNLAWAYLEKNNFKEGEEHYRKALSIEPDKNKQCNLAICLIHMNKLAEAKFLLGVVKASAAGDQPMDESFAKSYERAAELLYELESQGQGAQCSSEKENCENNYSHGKTTYASPSPVKGCLRSPSTQPKRGLLLERGICGDKPVNCPYRRLLFDNLKPQKQEILATALHHNCLNPKIQLRNQTTVSWGYPTPSKYNKTATASWSGHPEPTEDLIGKSWRNEQHRYTDTSDPSLKAGLNNEYCQENTQDFGKERNLLKTSATLAETGKSLPTFSQAEAESSGYSTNRYYDHNVTDNGSDAYQGEHGSNMTYKPKSWADMVEEEEQELFYDMSGEDAPYLPDHKASSSCPSNLLDGAKENLDSNMVTTQTQESSPQLVENIYQKFKSVDLEDGYEATDLSEEPSSDVCRSLSFDQQTKQEQDYSYLYLPQPDLVESIENASRLVPPKSRSRNRLQVFQDITPESPRP